MHFARRIFVLWLLVIASLATMSTAAAGGEAIRDRSQLPAGGPPAPAPSAPNGLGVTHQQLTGSRGTIWTSNAIPVCWENPTDTDATERGWVQSAAAATWEAASLVRFTGWQACAEESQGVRIRTGDYHPHTEALGSDLKGASGGMKLNFVWSGCGGATHQQCVQFVAVHEFGHALGFSHEQNRADAAPWCREQNQGHTGDIYITAYDPQSIMNYCGSSWNNGGRLSPSDIAGVQIWYGPAASSGQAWLPDCRTDVIFYQDINFGGKALQIGGTMDGLDIVDFNDRVSSVCVPAGVVIKLFEHAGFGGAVVTLAGPTMVRGLGRGTVDPAVDWNDRVSSVQMIDAKTGSVVFDAPQSCARSIVLFADSYFRGKAVPIAASVGNFKSIGFNDAASSLCVPAGKTVTVFEDADFKKKPMTLVGPAFRTDLGTRGWNDMASSIRVQ